MSSRIRRMQRATFRISLWQQIGAIGGKNGRQRGAIQQIGVDGISRGAHLGLMNTAAELFRAKAAGDGPLLVPRSLERMLRRGPEQTADVRSAECGESGFHFGGLVRVAGVQIRVDVEDCVWALVEQNQSRV